METNDNWIFYLRLKKNLPEDYLSMDQHFKAYGRSLIPIGLKALLEATKNKRTIHLLVIIKSYQDYRYYVRRVRKIMKYLMRTQRVHLYVASSFSLANDPLVIKKNYYSFVKLPVRMDRFCEFVSTSIEVRESNLLHWPGGVRPRLSLVG